MANKNEIYYIEHELNLYDEKHSGKINIRPDPDALGLINVTFYDGRNKIAEYSGNIDFMRVFCKGLSKMCNIMEMETMNPDYKLFPEDS